MRPPCLAVACHLGYITDTEVAYVLAIQEYCVWMQGLMKGKALQLAVAIGYLGREKIEPILQKQREFEVSGKTLRDPMNAVRRNPGRLTIERSGKKLIAGLAILAVIVTAVATRGDIMVIAAIASITALTTASLVALLSRHGEWTVRLTCAIEFLLFLALGVLFAYCGYQAWHLPEATPRNVGLSAVAGDWLGWLLTVSRARLLVSLLALAISVGCYAVLAHWRRMVIVSQREQIRKLGVIVAKARAPLPSIQSGMSAGSNVPAGFVTETLNEVVAVLSENCWASAVAWFVGLFGNKAPGTISVWFLEPNHAKKRFEISAYATSDLPNVRIRDAFKQIACGHTPSFMDKGKYKGIIQAAKGQHGDRWREVVADQLFLDEFVSLTGYVSACQVPVVCDDANACPVFRRRDYLKVLGQDVDDDTRKWLDFRCFGAWPVMARNNGSFEPRGVLVAFRNSKNAMSCSDIDALSAAAHLLALNCG